MTSDDTQDGNRPRRRPGAFRLDEAGMQPERAPEAEAATPSRTPRAIENIAKIRLDPEDAIEREAVAVLDDEPAARRKRRFSFGKLFLAALGLLISLGIGLAVDALVRDLFARWEWLGWGAVAERELLGPLDMKARALVLASSKRVSVVTAVSPKALVDVAYVLFETVKLIRRMSELYGARPGTLGLIRLTHDVVGHLAVTGTIGISDGLAQQLLGHGVAAKLSARLGEGVVNGLLTARVGLAAMDLCRPLPFLRLRRPSISDVLGDLTVIGAARTPQAASTEPRTSG